MKRLNKKSMNTFRWRCKKRMISRQTTPYSDVYMLYLGECRLFWTSWDRLMSRLRRYCRPVCRTVADVVQLIHCRSRKHNNHYRYYTTTAFCGSGVKPALSTNNWPTTCSLPRSAVCLQILHWQTTKLHWRTITTTELVSLFALTCMRPALVFM